LATHTSSGFGVKIRMHKQKRTPDLYITLPVHCLSKHTHTHTERERCSVCVLLSGALHAAAVVGRLSVSLTEQNGLSASNNIELLVNKSLPTV
jgi:hypothetical protein